MVLFIKMVVIFVLLIVFSVFFLFLFISTVWWINAWRYSRGLKDVKGPKPFPIIGNVTELDTTSKFLLLFFFVIFLNFLFFQRFFGKLMNGIKNMDT